MRRLAILIILVATAAGALPQQMPMPKTCGPQSDAQKAFEKLKARAGSWEGSIMGMPVQVTIRVTSSGNAILHEGTSSGMQDNSKGGTDATAVANRKVYASEQKGTQ